MVANRTAVLMFSVEEQNVVKTPGREWESGRVGAARERWEMRKKTHTRRNEMKALYSNAREIQM